MAPETTQEERSLEAIPQYWKDSTKIMHGSKLFKGASAYEILTKVAFGQAFGLTPAESQWAMHVVPGKPPSLSAQFIAARIKASDDYDYEIVSWDDTSCELHFYERSKRTEEWSLAGSATFTLADAKRAGLLKAKSPWETYPRAMLFNRALTVGARAYCPNLLYGNPMYTPEELLPPDDPVIVEEAEWAESQTGGLLVHDLNILPDDADIEAGIADIERVMWTCEHFSVSWDTLTNMMGQFLGIHTEPAEWTVADVKTAFTLLLDNFGREG